MAIPSLKFTAIALGISGVTLGTGVGIYNGFYKSPKEEQKQIITTTNVPEKKSITSLLLADKKKLLKKGENVKEKWNPLWKKFKDKYPEESKPPLTPWNFSDWKAEKAKEDAPEEFQTKCINNSSGEVEDSNSELYQAIKEYCTEDTTKEIQS